MKIFLIVLILIFSYQSLTRADDIREFEIQGLTLGDSLLEMYSEKQIENFINNKQANFYPNSKKFFLLATEGSDRNFDQLNIDLKYLDKNYIIYGISQYKRININECLKEKDLIKSEIKKMFASDEVKEFSYKEKHRADITGKSHYFSTDFEFKNGDAIRIVCTNWSNEFAKTGNFHDNLDVSFIRKEYLDFLTYEAYN